MDSSWVLSGGRHGLGVRIGEPAQRAQAGGEEVLAAAGDHERGQVLHPAADWALRDGEAGPVVVGSDEGVGLEWGADEDAVVEPLGLDELELPFEVGACEDEDDSAV